MLPQHTRRKHETSAMAARPHIAAEILPMVSTIAYNCTFIPAGKKVVHTFVRMENGSRRKSNYSTAAAPVLDTEAVAPAPVAQPAATNEARRSTRIRTQPKAYEPSMSGSRYSYAVTQLAEENVLHPDAHMFLQDDFYQSEPDVVAAIMTQLSLKRGLQEWGDNAYLAAESEMKQLHFRNTFKPMLWKDLSATQRQTILESHMFLKEKRDGSIKGRTVAGGNKQRDYISKEDASSPTVATESVLLSCIIDAEEG
jgi:hypothetical protein